MTDKDQQQEPSMEEILASIRRIIAEEEPEGEGTAAATAAEPAPKAEEDILDLTEVVDDDELGREEDLAPREKLDFAMADDEDEEDEKVSQNDIDALFGSADDSAFDEGMGDTPSFEEEPSFDVAPADDAFDALTDGAESLNGGADPSGAAGGSDEPFAPVPVESGDSLLSETTQAATAAALASLTGAVGQQGGGQPVTAGGRTLEDLVAELLKPMLKQWLDNNLPPLVERLVRQEIERLAERVRS